MIYLDHKDFISKDLLLVIFAIIVLSICINPRIYNKDHLKKSDESLNFVAAPKVELAAVSEATVASNENYAVLDIVKEPVVNHAVSAVGIPQHLSIPAINIEIKLDSVGLAADGSIAVPNHPKKVGWFNLGPKPGEKGSAIVVGHYGTWYDGSISVFQNLNQLKPGDLIYVKDDKGNTLSFEVKESRVYNLESYDPSIFNQKDDSYLNLITCAGEWISSIKTYDKRLVVFTKLVSI